MITSIFLNIIYALVVAIIGILPTISLSSAWTNAIVTVGSYIAVVHEYVPATVTAVLAVIGSFLVIEAGILIYKIVMWAIRKIPGVG